MCTVSYLPSETGFILTSNRDEAPERGVIEVDQKTIDGNTLYFPKDPLAGGTWFAFSSNGSAASLLNGAYEPYDRSLAFSKSRGIVLLESFEYDRIQEFLTSRTYVDAAPFTLVIARPGKLYEVIWDGHSATMRVLDPLSPHFWSSVTLYPEDKRAQRRTQFETWRLNHPVFRQDDIMHFHRYGGDQDPEYGFVMNRNEVVKTLSISSVAGNADSHTFRHINLNDPDGQFECTLDKTEPSISA